MSLMKKKINKILESIGYEVIKKLPPEKNNLKSYFDLTQGSISYNEWYLLYNLARQVKGNTILEVGSYRGRSTVALGLGSINGNKVPVYAIEPHEEFTGILGNKFGYEDRGIFYKTMLTTSCYEVVRLINLSSEIISPQWNTKIGFLWIDGDHSYQAVKRDFESWRPHLENNSFIAFHDSIDAKLGPKKLIDELLKTGEYEIVDQIDLTTTIKFK
jgi:hypothetical protein